MSSFFLLSIIITLLIMTICCQSKNNVTFSCIPSEKKALVRFKESFTYDPSNMLSSWKNNVECCSWAGVECDNATGHVVGLHLRYMYEYGSPSPDGWLTSDTIDPSLLELKYLRYLDLSGNDFSGSSIPTFLGSMKQLQYLNLSIARFGGIVPCQLGNLSSLRELDLERGVYTEYNHLIADDVTTWVANLSSLEYLDMSHVNLNRAKDIIKVLGMLPSLVDLRLSKSGLGDTSHPHVNCLNGSTPLFTNVQHLDLSLNWFGDKSSFCFLHNMTSLSFLDLSSNSFHKKADWISDLLWDKCHLKSLNMMDNELHGDISGAFRNLSGCWGHNLESINFRGNKLNGHLPEELGELKQLTELDISNNKLSGLIPPSIGNLKALISLDLSINQLGGEIPVSLGQLLNLETIHVENNKLSGPIPSSIGNLRALRVLDLSNNQLGGEIPISLGQLSNLESIVIFPNALEGTLSEAHLDKLSRLESFYIGSNNGIKFIVGDDWVPPFQLKTLLVGSMEIGDRLPQWLKTHNSLQELILWNCSIRGTLPAWLGSMMNLTLLDLSNNHIHGPIPDLPSGMIDLDLSKNFNINGSIPKSLCRMKDLRWLDLSKNHISGNLPGCNWRNLYSAKLSYNQLSGAIPISIGRADQLILLQLSNNGFTGQIPFTLKNCADLSFLDIGDNKLFGNLPHWIGNHLSLRFLKLRNNKFYGDVPSSYCELFVLQVMDLAHNQLTGNIPHCFGNLSGMINSQIDYFGYTDRDSSFSEVMKGALLEYTSTSIYLVNLDLSSNRLVGVIPSELTNLIDLNGLNLSHNHLGGQIPRRIGDLKSLESFDLSNNNLSGEIPGSLSKLTSLSFLNLSNNNLSGQIPTGPQLQTLNDHSSYDGNPGLCGDPLVKKCHISNNKIPMRTRKVENDDGGIISDKISMYAFITSGVATGFWGYFGVLFLKRSLRLALFRRMDVLIAKTLGRY